MTTPILASKPLHIQLREELLRRIASGEWKVGEPIPNEQDLAKAFGLSPGTVRKALDWLESAKLVIRQQGRGTFVRDPASVDIAERYMRVRTAEGKVPDLEAQVLDVQIVEGDAYECAALGLKPGAMVRRARRRNFMGTVPLSYETSSVPLELFPMSIEEAWQLVPLPILAKRCGLFLGRGEERLSLKPADAELAEKLACAVGEQVFYYERLVETLDGRPAEWKRGHGRLPAGHYYSVPLGLDIEMAD